MAENEDLYQYLTDLVIQEMQGAGFESLLQILQTPDISVEESNEISSEVFTELLMTFEQGKLDSDQILAFLDVAITDDDKATAFAQVFDVFPLSESLRDLLAKVGQTNAIQPATYAQHINLESIILAGIVAKDNLFRQLNTRKRDEFYTQKKYNLLYEEFEGYSKLINEFYSILRNPENEFEVEYAVTVVEQLMGHFQLDPNRVLDVLLDVFSNTIVGNHRFMISFLKLSRWWPSTESDSKTGMESLNRGGCEQAAKLIGLRVAKHSKDREFPETFKVMIAILIKEGFLSFGSIYKCMAESQTTMEKLEEKYKKDLEDKVFRASASALALAAPLIDDEEQDENATQTSSSADKTKALNVTLEEMLKHNFEFQFLKSCLGNGLYWPSIYILSIHPFLAYVDSEIQELMTRLLGAIITPLYELISPASQVNLSVFQQEKPTALSRALNKVQLEDSPNTQLYCIKPTAREFGSKSLTYFYTEWNKDIPVVRNSDDLLLVSKQYLKFLGVLIATDLDVMQKICEIVVADLAADNSAESKEKWLNYYRNFILPAVSAIEDNPIPVDKAYEILKFFEPEDRYNLYGELHQVLAKNNPHVKVCYGKAEKNTKDLLKRLSKENVKQMMRRLAKISYSNPLPCFLTILQQIESYDNLNSLVVESAKFFSEYGWDNLTLAILMRLTASGRSNVQADGLNERQWIQSLASFIGKICRSYPDSVDLSTMVQYLLKSFHSNETAGLIVLKEMLSSMGGFQAITNLTSLQINMINCGSCMEKVVYRTIGDERFQNTKSGSTLCSTFFKLEVVNELLVLLCRTNRNIVSGDDFSHLKALANKIDEVDAVTRLLCTLVGFFGREEAASHLLPIGELVETYNVPIAWAFEIWREHLDDSALPGVEASLESQLGNVFSSLSPNLFTRFWKLKLYDLNYSGDLYDSELEKLQAKVVSLKENIAFLRRDKEVSSATIQALRDDLVQTENFSAEIPKRKAEHEKHCLSIEEEVKVSFGDWFTKELSQQNVSKFVELCVLPRAIHSSFDALYTAKFLFFLHRLGTQNFSLFGALATIFRGKLLFGTLFTCTSTEAENLGLFVSEVFKVLNSWASSDTFAKQVEAVPFVDEQLNAIDFSGYRALVFKFHVNVLENITEALHVVDYMSRRNAITFLKNLLGVYPTVEDHCENVIELIENISKRETRDDLKLSSSALIGHVKSRSASWVHIWDFIDMSEEDKAENVARRQKLEDERKKAAEAIKQKELLKKEEERKRLEKERLDKLEKERAAQHQQASANALNYSESAVRSERPAVRGHETSRGRYDVYSKAASTKDHSKKDESASKAKDAPPELSTNGKTQTQPKPQSADGRPQTKPQSADGKPQPKPRPQSTDGKTQPKPKPQSVEGKTQPKPQNAAQPSVPTAKTFKPPATAPTNGPAPSRPKATHIESDSDDLFKLKAPGRPTQVSTSALKSKLQEARKANTSRGSTPSGPSTPTNGGSGTPRAPAPAAPAKTAPSRSPAAQSKPNENARTRAAAPPPPPPAAASRPISTPHSARRAPLPPQQAPRDPRSGYRNDNYARSNSQHSGRGTSSGSSTPLGAPLPPPSLPPPKIPPPAKNSENGQRGSDKRRYDGLRGRGYDKRQRY